MFNQLLFYFPAAACIFWLVTFFVMGRKTKGFWATELFIFVCAVYYFCGANSFNPGQEAISFKLNFLLFQFFAPCLIPASLVYLESINPNTKKKQNIYAWTLIPCMCITAEFLLAFFIGSDRTDRLLMSIISGNADLSNFAGIQERLLIIISCYIFYAVIGIQIACFLIWLGVRMTKERQDSYHLSELISGKVRMSKIDQQHLLVTALIAFEFVRLAIPAKVTLSHEWVGALLGFVNTLLLFFIFFNALLDQKNQTGTEIAAAEERVEVEDETGVEESPEDNSETTDGEEVQTEYYEPPVVIKKERPVFDDADLKARFETLMLDEQLFLTQGITLTDIAARLHSNKTYISRLVNTNYHTTFPDYLNTLRIDYAEQYILRHRDAKQIEIAKACGFPSASAFNNTFKKVTGETPKVWLATKK